MRQGRSRADTRAPPAPMSAASRWRCRGYSVQSGCCGHLCLNWPYPQGRNHLRMTTRTNMDNSRHTGVAPQPASPQKALPQCGQPKGSPPRGNLITHYLPQPGGVPLTTPLTAVKSVRDSGSPLEGHPEVTSQGREHTSLPNGTRHGPCHSYAPARAPGPNGRTPE
jgi:hypothetical protein